MKKKYTHIFFDLDNTLWDFKKNSRLAMETTFSSFNVALQNCSFDSFFEVYTDINHQLWEAYRKKEVSKKELTRKRFQLTFEALQLTGIDADVMNESYLTEMPKQKILEEGAIVLLEYLKKKRYKLFIITNGFSEVQHIKLKTSGLSSYFSKVFISEEIKCPKPGQRIFEHAIKSTNAKKSKSLMIGDDWDVDIMGALKFGIDTVYYSSKINNENDFESHKYKSTLYGVSSLADLKKVI